MSVCQAGREREGRLQGGWGGGGKNLSVYARQGERERERAGCREGGGGVRGR